SVRGCDGRREGEGGRVAKGGEVGPAGTPTRRVPAWGSVTMGSGVPADTASVSVARTTENVSATGSPAATIAPKATSRMAIVIGTVLISARLKSLPIDFSSAWSELALPNSAT